MIVNAAQIRAARGLLRWSQARLAQAAGLHINAVRYWEGLHAMPLQPPSSDGYGCRRIEDALIKAGVVLIDAPSPGVMINPDRMPHRYTPWRKASPTIPSMCRQIARSS